MVLLLDLYRPKRPPPQKGTPRKLTWNLKRSPYERKLLLETIIFRFHVKFRGSTPLRADRVIKLWGRLRVSEWISPTQFEVGWPSRAFSQPIWKPKCLAGFQGMHHVEARVWSCARLWFVECKSKKCFNQIVPIAQGMITWNIMNHDDTSS